MAWQVTPYTGPLVGSAVISLVLLGVVSRYRAQRGAVPVLGVLLAAVLWSTVDAIRVSSTVPGIKLLMNDVRFLGPILVTVSVFLLAAVYTDRDQWVQRERVAAVAAVHALTFGLVVTNSFHHLVRRGYTLRETGGFVTMAVEWGPWYYLHAGYSYLLLAGAAAMLVDRLVRGGGVDTYRGQTVAVLVATGVPWAMNASYVLGVTRVDLTPAGFTVTGVLLVVAILRYQFLDLAPIARSTAIDNIDGGYLVVDTDDTIVDINEAGADMVGADADALAGRSIHQVFGATPTVLDQFATVRDTREQVELDLDGTTRFFDVDISPVYDRRDRYTGRVVLFSDVTERERRKRQLEHQKAKLEHQNERLDEFASVVSHDLRNPISVLAGRLELARQDPSEEHFDEMAASIERMERIVDDVLTMARQGRTVADPEQLAVADLCRDAWATVDTGTATLAVETDLTVEGDRDRLLRLFENLFRNAVEHGSTGNQTASSSGDAVEHGGPAVTVTVGDLPDGFYVADDGPGIPPEDRDDVLQKGYTTADDGTGFGLSIVSAVVEAHGWTVDVTESDAGGARFEVAGVVAEQEGATDVGPMA